MDIINFDNCERPSIFSQRHYGGLSGNKEHIIIDGENWFLKYPANIRGKFTNVELSYSNSPLCEYLGSKIYEFLDIPVHKTLLGISPKTGHVLVACKDFLKNGEKLDEFSQIKVSFAPHNLDSSSSSGSSCNLRETVSIIKDNEFLKSVYGVEERFWDMFVVDAFIGNSDRNNGNWGIIRKLDGTNELSPVYDNGNSFNNKWDLGKIRLFQSDHEKFISEAYTGKTCIFSHTEKTGEEKKLNPFKVIQSEEYEGLNEAVKRLTSKISTQFETITNFINEIPNEAEGIPIISDEQKHFYIDLMRTRYNKVFVPTVEKLNGRSNAADIHVNKASLDNHDISPAKTHKKSSGWSR